MRTMLVRSRRIGKPFGLDVLKLQGGSIFVGSLSARQSSRSPGGITLLFDQMFCNEKSPRVMDSDSMLVTTKCRQPVQRYAATTQDCLCDKAVVSNTQMQGLPSTFEKARLCLTGHPRSGINSDTTACAG